MTVDNSTTPDGLMAEDLNFIILARKKTRALYEGVQVPHRSCEIALAETFNLPTRPYQALAAEALVRFAPVLAANTTITPIQGETT